MCGAQTQKYIEMQATKCMRLQMTTGIFDFCFQLLLLILIFLSGISCALFQRLHFTHTHVYFYWRINMHTHTRTCIENVYENVTYTPHHTICIMMHNSICNFNLVK